MCATNGTRPNYLSLDELPADPSLARLLPLELAYRFHALPVAQQDGRVTVAMADPDDGEAVSAIAAVLGGEPCVVQGDALRIDASLDRAWGQVPHAGPRVQVCTPVGPTADAVVAYARLFAAVLGAEVRAEPCGDGLEAVGDSSEPGCDLLVVDAADVACTSYWLAAAAGERAATVPPALLVARAPRWPVTKILLIVSGEDADPSAADWVLRLATSGTSSVNVLAVVPPPIAFQGRRRAAVPRRERDLPGLPALLAGDTRAGHGLQQVARRLEEGQIASSLRLRQGPAEWQIRRELSEEDHDLVVAAQPAGVDPDSSGNLAAVLLRWSRCPALIVRPVDG